MFQHSSIGGTEILLVILALALQSLLVGTLWLYPIVECSIHHPKGPKKDLWILCITALPLLGGLIYLIFGRASDKVDAPSLSDVP